MNRYRNKKRRLSIQTLESRRVLAASIGWDGPGLGSATLTYNIANSPSSLTQGETNAAIETALAAWSAAADITFVPTSQTGLRDSIDISFANIDGAGGTLAQAYFPDDVNPARIAGDIQFDLSEVWEVGNSAGNRAFDLVWVAVHEIGHSLGLDHAEDIASVLAPFVSPRTQFVSLAAADVSAIQQLYAAPETDDPSDEPPTTVTPAEETPTEAPSFNDPTRDDPTRDDPVDTGDTDDDPFPRWRWRRGGHWQRWGGRLDADIAEHHHLYNPTDVNSDGNTTAGDALTIINQSSRFSSTNDVGVAGMCDVNGDGSIMVSDALMVINTLNSVNSGGGTTVETVQDDDEIVTVEEIDAAAAVVRTERFDQRDTSGDGLLQVDEVSERFWELISDADTNADAGISLEELDAFVAARQAGTNQDTEIHHSHERLDRVFGQLVRGRIRAFGRFR